MKILVINGPNLNMLGKRESKHYGSITLKQINNKLKSLAKSLGATLSFFQSNLEGEIINFLQNEASRKVDGVLINPGALTHYGYSLRDALVDIKLPIVEVHLSNIDNREAFRKVDILDGIVLERIMGLKEKSYFLGLQSLVMYLKGKKI